MDRSREEGDKTHPRPAQDERPFWKVDADLTNALSDEVNAGREPVADEHSPVADRDEGAKPSAQQTARANAPAGQAKPNAAQLRDAIDRGETEDKVAHPDPAAAPLGTDAEAGGAPPQPHEVAIALNNETASPAPPAGDNPWGSALASRTRVAIASFGVAIVALAAAAATVLLAGA